MGDFFSGENALEQNLGSIEPKSDKKRPSTSNIESLELPSAKKAKYVLNKAWDLEF